MKKIIKILIINTCLFGILSCSKKEAITPLTETNISATSTILGISDFVFHEINDPNIDMSFSVKRSNNEKLPYFLQFTKEKHTLIDFCISNFNIVYAKIEVPIVVDMFEKKVDGKNKKFLVTSGKRYTIFVDADFYDKNFTKGDGYLLYTSQNSKTTEGECKGNSFYTATQAAVKIFNNEL